MPDSIGSGSWLIVDCCATEISAADCRDSQLMQRIGAANRFGGKDCVDAQGEREAGRKERQQMKWPERRTAKKQRTGKRVYRTNARSCIVTRNYRRRPPAGQSRTWHNGRAGVLEQ